MLRTNDKVCVVQLRLSKEEKDKLIETSNLMGMSCSEFIRQSLSIAYGCSNKTLEQTKSVLNSLFDNLIDSIGKDSNGTE